MNYYLPVIWLAKIVSGLSRLLNRGAGSTWPGHIVLKINPDFIREINKLYEGNIILVAGTNGKTTTSKMIAAIIGEKEVISNPSGANLLNGTASAFVNNMDWYGKVKKKYAILEVDEMVLPLLLNNLKPKIIICLNLFRDQLDRYGEVDTIAEKWKASFRQLPKTTTLILNADDPEVASIGEKLSAKVFYFGLEEESKLQQFEHATDSIFCPNCGKRLVYDSVYFSHLGHWKCNNCGLKRPEPHLSTWPSPLPGTYLKYDTLGAVLTAKTLGFADEKIEKILKHFSPAFGRQEEIIVNNKKVKIILSKNPTGFNQSIDTMLQMPDKKKDILIALNDLIVDGKDISWIWDVDFEKLLPMMKHLTITGTRVKDLAVRMKHAGAKDILFINDFKKALQTALEKINKTETLYILPTYSAMLEVRKILVGRKLL